MGQQHRSPILYTDGALSRLTERELSVLALVAQGKSNKEIAQALFITVHTVKAHISRILHKLDKATRTEAAIVYATRDDGSSSSRQSIVDDRL